MRVIAGALGGRRLVAPRGRATRPTSDRAREAMFSMLGDVTGLIVLDLYAGSGALGIEALSRGASFASFVEKSPAALAALRQNLDALQLTDRSFVAPVAVRRFRLEESAEPADLVFCDPPWAELTEAVRAVEALVDDVLRSGGQLVLEHPAGAEPEIAPELGLALQQRRRWGDTGASFFRKITEKTP